MLKSSSFVTSVDYLFGFFKLSLHKALFFCGFISGFFANAQTNELSRIALVIGNSQYTDLPKLTNPNNDAMAVSETLESLNFEVLLLTDATKEEIKETIKSFSKRIEGYETVLFYYAGHGIEILGKNYMVPVDAQASTVADVKRSCISTNSVLSLMRFAKSENNIVILDACRENPFTLGEASMLSDGLALMDAPEGTIVSFATSPGNVASDGSGDNGRFTEALLEYLPQYDLEIKEMFEKVRGHVINVSAGQQVPWESTSLVKPLVLRRSPEAPLQVAIAEGDSITFERQGTLHAQTNLSDVSLVWYWNGRQVSNQPNLEVNMSGIYHVKGISFGGQILVSNPIRVRVKSFVDLQVYIAEGEVVKLKKDERLHAKSNVRGTYTWLRNQLKIGEGPSIPVEASGLYNVSIRTADGRKATTPSTKVILVEP